MKQIKKWWVFLILILSLSAIQDEQSNFTPLDDIDNYKKELKDFSDNTKSIQSDFIQEKHLSMLDEIIISKGSFSFNKENSVRWEYHVPIQYTIVIHDGKFSIKDGEKVSSFDVNSNFLFRQINTIIVSIVSGMIPGSEEFEIHYYENPELYELRLIPVQFEVAEMLKSIRIFQAKKDLTVRKVIISESNEDFTVLNFQNTHLNVDIPKENFKLQLP